MARITVTRSINAPVQRVFPAVADIREFRKIQPQIVDVEFLGDQQIGKGTRFRETRVMGGNRASTDLEVTEYVPDRLVRMVADSYGTVWDTTFAVSAAGPSTTELTMTMEARPHTLKARLMNVLLVPLVRRAVAEDMDRVKVYCERPL